MQLKDGTLLYEGKYRIIRFISSSEYGFTYEAMSTRTSNRVAIKEFFLRNCSERHSFNDEVSASSLEKVELMEKMKKRFVDEARSLFQFNHPNIVHVNDVFLQNGTAYYSMDYVEGTTLKEMVQQRGRLSENEALTYMGQLCDAIEYVHSKNRVHLDIRPANVIVTSDGRVKLADFGFSKRLDPSDYDPNITGLNVSTNSYSPLELNVDSDEAITPVSDVYSLGATLYKLLTGNTPPDAAMLVDYPLAELPEGISPNVSMAIKKAMSPNKADRPQSVVDFRRMLHAPVHAAATENNIHHSASGGGNSNNPYSDSYSPDNTGYHNNSVEEPTTFGDTIYNSNGFSPHSGVFQDENTGFDGDDATMVTPEKHRGSEMSRIDFHLDSIGAEDGRTEMDSSSSTVDPSGNSDFSVNPGIDFGNSNNYGDSGNFGRYGNSGNQTGSSTSGNRRAGNRSGGSRSSSSASSFGNSGGKKLNYGFVAAIVVAVLLLVGGGYWVYQQFFAHKTPAGSSAVVEAVPATSLGSLAENNPELMGELNGHFWVDLGLPSGTKWATTNVGASVPNEFGEYYAWGETQAKNVYNYENAATYEKPMGDIAGNTTFDVAAKQWGQAWRLPSKDEYEELLNNCSYQWVTMAGVRGGLLTSRKNGQSIFLPAAGFRYGVITSDADASYVGTEGAYWTSTPASNDAVQENAYGLRLYGNSIQDVSDKFHRGAGRSVRAVAR